MHGDDFIPIDNLLPGDIEVLLAAGEANRLPVGDGCRYRDGTTIAGSFECEFLLLSSLAAAKLGTTHFDGTGDADLFDDFEIAGEG